MISSPVSITSIPIWQVSDKDISGAGFSEGSSLFYSSKIDDEALLNARASM